MDMRSLRGTGVGFVAAFSVVALLASTADARVFRMTGKWLQQRGPNVQIPIFGGIDNVPGALVTATGSSPATLTVGPGLFTGMNQFLFALPITTIVQLSTQFNFFGPDATGVLKPGPKTSRPANFGFCPGAAANPACTTHVSGGNQGTRHGLVRYVAGPNQFGGTMQMLLTGFGSLTTVIGTSPTRLQHNLIGGGTMGGLQEQGGVYANTDTDFLPAGPITTGAVCPGGPCAANNGLVTAPGVLTTMVGTNSTNTNTGFPWTTGMVSAIVTTRAPTTVSSLTATGSDSRTDLGLGNITLVSGGISTRSPSGMNFSSLDAVTMTLEARNLPAMSPAGLVSLTCALLIGAGFVSRRRWNRRPR